MTTLSECADPEAVVHYVGETLLLGNVWNTTDPRVAAVACELLMCLVHAAGLSSGTETDVLAWAEDDGVEAPLAILHRHYGSGPAIWPDRLRAFQALDRETAVAARAELLHALTAQGPAR